MFILICHVIYDLNEIKLTVCMSMRYHYFATPQRVFLTDVPTGALNAIMTFFIKIKKSGVRISSFFIFYMSSMTDDR